MIMIGFLFLYIFNIVIVYLNILLIISYHMAFLAVINIQNINIRYEYF